MAALISSRKNERIKATVRLHQKKYRDQTGCFLIEGIKLFKEAIASNVQIESVYYTSDFMKRAKPEVKIMSDCCVHNKIPVFEVTEVVMELLSTLKMPEGIVAVAKKMPEYKFQELHKLQTCVILEDVQDPGNVGTIIRTADAAGFSAIICSEKTADIYNEKVLRASMGSIFHLPVFFCQNVSDFLPILKEQEIKIIGTSLQGSTNPFGCDGQNAVALVLGNESKGMSGETAAQCDQLYKIPMYGKAESLNVSVAAGILLYDVARALHKS